MTHAVNILILEDEAAVAEPLRVHIGNTMPSVLPLVARSIGEANVLTYQYEFSTFIVDTGLPDGTGVEFIGDVRTVFPEANLIVMNDADADDLVRQLAHFGAIPIVQKPIDMQRITSLLSGMLPKTESQPEELSGSFRKLRLVDLIQVKCLGMDSCRVTIYNPSGGYGVIGFSQGMLVHAAVTLPTGAIQGKAAFAEMLRWKNGSFQEQDHDPDLARNIHEPWELVLLDAVRQADEFNSVEVA